MKSNVTIAILFILQGFQTAQGLLVGLLTYNIIVQKPEIGLIMWLGPKDLKMCCYVEKCDDFKNQTLEKLGLYTKVLCATEYPGIGNISK